MTSSIFDVKTFGALGDGHTPDDAAFQRALDAIAALSPGDVGSRGAILFIPFGVYRLQKTLHIIRRMIIQGVSGVGFGSVLIFDPDVDGIFVHHLNEGKGGAGEFTLIRDLSIQSNNLFAFANCPNPPINEDDPLTAPPSHTNHPVLTGNGIVLHGSACIENCVIVGFHYDGITIESVDIPTTNANFWEIHNCQVITNGRHGLYLAGDNSNAGRAIGLRCAGNCGWGVYDRSFLGNTYVACLVENNGHAATEVQVLAINPGSPTNFYIGAHGGGLFTSGDGGATWSANNRGLAVLNVQALAIDPTTTPTTLYVGTLSHVDVFIGGVFKSTVGADGVLTWSLSNNGLTSTDIYALAIDPTTPTILYAGTSGGAFKTTDGAANWNPINQGLTSADVRVFLIDPQAPDTLYTGTRGGGVFKSTDGGASWNASNNGLTSTDIRALVIDPTTPTILYAGTSGGAFKSTNGGANWNPVNQELSTADIRVLAIDAKTPATLYAGTSGGSVFKSTDGGANWSASSIGSSTLVVQALAIDPVTPTMLYAGTDSGGVFRSTDGGVNWRASNNPYYGGAYKTIGSTAAINVLLNCYSEAGQGYGSELIAPTLALGGLHGDGASPISNAGLIDVARSGAITGLLQKGPIEYAVRTIAPATNTVVNIEPDDSIIFVDGSRAGAVLVLPPAPPITGRKFTVKRVDDPTNNPRSVFFEVLTGGTIDGKPNYPPNPFSGETFSGTVTFVADETEYKIVQQENDAVGQTMLRANTSSVSVNTTAATPTSTILLTPLDNPEGQLWITRAAGSFTINASAAPTRDVPIAYLIKNE